MEKRNKGKIIAIIIAAVIAAGGITVGIMAASGVFESDKKKAFELLAQLPERMGYSATNEYIGMEELLKVQEEKGMTYGLEMSHMDLSELIEESELDVSGYKWTINSQTDAKQGKTNATISIEKEDTPVSLNYYVDSDKTVFSVPELVKEKAFQMKKEDQPETVSDLDVSVVNRFDKDFNSFLKEEVKKVKDKIECEKLEDGSGYELLISADAMNVVMDDFVSYMEKQKDMVDFINAYVDTIRKNEEEAEEIEPFDFMTSLKKVVEECKKNTQDFTFTVYEEEGVLVGIRLPITMEQIKAEIMLEFAGVKENSTVTMDVSVTYRGYKATATLIKKSVKKDVCSVQWLLDVTVVGKPVASLTLVETIKPANNGYSVSCNATAMGKEIAVIDITGSIKDLQKGKSVTFVLDDVNMKLFGEITAKMSMNMQLGVLEGEVEPPKGEIVEYTDGTSIEPYSDEILTNVMGVVSAWGLEEALLPFLVGEGFEDLTEVAA